MKSLCFYFQCSRTAYYKQVKSHQLNQMQEQLIIELVLRERRIQPRLGSKKLYFLLKSELSEISPNIGRDKFISLLKKYDLLILRKKSYIKTTNSYHRFYKYNNLLSGHEISDKNQVWAADITYIRTHEGFVYLSLITDMYSRKIVGWELSKSLSIDGTLTALKKALRENQDIENLIHHSDRGIQYCSYDYTGLLNKNHIKISMTQENHCYENALAERVNGILKDEYLLDSTFKNYTLAYKSCKEAIHIYNTRRPHLSLNLKTPEQMHKAV